MFNKRERTPKQKATSAQTSVFIRLIACGYLIYLMVQLIQTARNENPPRTWEFVVAGVMILLSALVLVITLVGAYRSWKAGLFKEATYFTGGQPGPADAADAVESGTDAGSADGGADPWDNASDRTDPWDDGGGRS